MAGRGQTVICPSCKKEFQISKSSKDGDFEKCPECFAHLEVIKKKKKLDVRLIEKEDDSFDIEIHEYESDE